jgi:hypothetical protein
MSRHELWQQYDAWSRKHANEKRYARIFNKADDASDDDDIDDNRLDGDGNNGDSEQRQRTCSDN